MEGMEDRVCNRGCGPFKSHREGVALEGSWKDMEGMEVRGCNGGEGPLRATGREGVVLEWVGRVLEGHRGMGWLGWKGPGRSQRHGMERLLQPHQQQRLQPVH